MEHMHAIYINLIEKKNEKHNFVNIHLKNMRMKGPIFSLV